MLLNVFYCLGYFGNGFLCVDINECEINNGGCFVNLRVDCINMRGLWICGFCLFGKWNILIIEINLFNGL